MAITQLSVFLENKPGALSDVVRTISGAGINIRAMSLADTRDFGILRIIVSDVEATEAVLKERSIVSRTEVLAVGMDDRAGALNDVLGILEEAGVNIEYMYAFTSTGVDRAYVVLRVDDVKAAEEKLTEAGQTVLSDESLRALL